MKIVVLDGYAANPNDISWDALRALGDVTIYERSTPENAAERAADAEILLTNKVPVTRDLIGRLKKLKYVGVLATGYNIVDIDAAREAGVYVANVPAYSTASVAQLTFALILEICHHVGAHSDACLNGTWQNSADFCFWNYPLTELAGKTIGLIGYGAIGRAVGEIAKAMQMNVLAYSPSRCDRSMLDRIFAESDIISLHCPLKAENSNLISAATIMRMKDGVWIINTARGGLVNEADVAAALNSGKIGYFAADVVSKEPIAADNPLLQAQHVILTPHIAWAPYEARVRLMNIAVDNVRAFIDGKPINIVNGLA